MKVLLITGGDSSERTVSLNSAKNVEKALIENNHTVFVYDLRLSYEPVVELSKNFDVLFPVLHGEEGEGGKLHEFLSKLKIPIVGTRNYKGLQKAWYKIQFKKYCDKNEVSTAPWREIKNEQDVLDFGFPNVVKSSAGGTSIEVFPLKSLGDLKKSKNKIFKCKSLFVERYISGIEVTVGILNKIVLPLIEIIPPIGMWFDYKNKYSPETKEIPFAPSVSENIQKEIKKISLGIHEAFDLGSYSRIDFIIDKNKTYVLEVNTIPGMTAKSLYPKMAKAAGISFNELIEILIKSAK